MLQYQKLSINTLQIISYEQKENTLSHPIFIHKI